MRLPPLENFTPFTALSNLLVLFGDSRLLWLATARKQLAGNKLATATPFILFGSGGLQLLLVRLDRFWKRSGRAIRQDFLRSRKAEELDQPADHARPTSLVVGANAGAVVAVKVFIEQKVVSPQRVCLELFGAAKVWASPFLPFSLRLFYIFRMNVIPSRAGVRPN